MKGWDEFICPYAVSNLGCFCILLSDCLNVVHSVMCNYVNEL